MGYHYRRIRKHSGASRLIAKPSPDLMRAQRRLAARLVSIKTEDAAYGFVVGRSFVTNAAKHVGRAIVIKLDIRHFYPSITERRVLGLFRKLRGGSARRLASLCIDPRTGSLPQGAPTSPAISNLILGRLDRRLSALAARLDWTFTRYADDLTFSSDSSEKSNQIVAHATKIVGEEGFAIHRKKTRIMLSGSRQVVTGVIVNDKPALPRPEVRRLRAILHNAERTGLALQNRDGIERWEDYLRGKIGLLRMIDPEKAAPMVAQLEALIRRGAVER